jgi:hypothetical protein
MYTQIEGMMGPEEAADSLVFHATNIAAAIKRNDNCFFNNRAASLKAILGLLGQYVEQEASAGSQSSPANEKLPA